MPNYKSKWKRALRLAHIDAQMLYWGPLDALARRERTGRLLVMESRDGRVTNPAGTITIQEWKPRGRIHRVRMEWEDEFEERNPYQLSHARRRL